MQLKSILPRCSRPAWAKQRQEHLLGSILDLIVVSPLRGRRGTKPAPLLGRRLTRRQIAHLGFSRGTASCHATLSETLRVIDARALDLGARYLEVSRRNENVPYFSTICPDSFKIRENFLAFSRRADCPIRRFPARKNSPELGEFPLVGRRQFSRHGVNRV